MRETLSSRLDPYVFGNTRVPNNLIQKEITGLYGSSILAEMGKIIKYYKVYEEGADFDTSPSLDYIPAKLKTKAAKALIDKEARFLFGRKPDFTVNVQPAGTSVAEVDKNNNTILQNLIDKVLAKNNIGRKLLQAAKDCFIGKRVALMANFNEDGITINFIPSLEFVFETDTMDADRITKIVAFFTIKDGYTDKGSTVLYKKKFWLAEDGYCHYEEGTYDGFGTLIEAVHEDEKTLFIYIPATIIINDGLIGDISGVSEIGCLEDYESWYSELNSADMDAERKGMNPITYAVDMSVGSTKNISRAAGAFWDLQSEQNEVAENIQGRVGILESSMAYSTALDTTLKRIKRNMYQQVEMPEIEEVQAQLSSGKALKAIYWGLIGRCDEKMLAWKPALEFLCKCIIDGAILYPASAAKYSKDKIPMCVYEVVVENQYPLQDDELEAVQSDVVKVNAQTMSRKSFIKKWNGMTDEEAMDELKQIALESELLNDSFSSFSPTDKVQPKEQDEDVDEPEVPQDTNLDDGTGDDGSENKIPQE